MKKLPIGIQDFKYMIDENYLYIDKTKYLYMLKDRGKFYFMSRPRRFGKSLTVSTYDYMFRGKKELFKDTWLYDNWDFDPKPVIRFSMSELDRTDEKTIEESLIFKMEQLYEVYDIPIKTRNMKLMFSDLLEKVGKQKRAVVLIDEYDKPILDHLHDVEMAEKIRNKLRLFYSSLKDADPWLDFVFVTGITKFTKVGVFSTLNNLQDISTNIRYASMMGYTKDELEHYFEGYIAAGMEQENQTYEAFMARIKEQYDGFSFDGRHFVYNPFSLLNYFDAYEFENYWMESGSPSFIVKYASSHNIAPDKLLGNYVEKDILTTYEIEKAPPVSFLLQAGYLTFKAYNKDYGYLIDYPNKEVRDSFSKLLLLSEYKMEPNESNDIRKNITKALMTRDFELLYKQMCRTLSNIPYTLFERKRKVNEDEADFIVRQEAFYHAVILTMLWSAGVKVKAEELTALGRSDLILEYGNDVYIMELKKQSPEVSLKQIEDKNYAGKYSGTLYYVGIEIEDKKRNLGNWLLSSNRDGSVC